MQNLILAIVALVSFNASAVCTAYCKPGKSYACGQGCISIYKLCRKPTTTACNGARPPEASKHYKNPKKIEPKVYGGAEAAEETETLDSEVE